MSWVVVPMLAATALSACSEPRATTVLIVGKEETAFRGSLAVEMDASGQLRPKFWMPGNIVVFRASTDLRGQRGDSAGIYRIGKDSTLTRIGTADLGKTDDELAAQFGVRTGTNKTP